MNKFLRRKLFEARDLEGSVKVSACNEIEIKGPA